MLSESFNLTGIPSKRTLSYDAKATRVVLSVEACSFIQGITGDIPVQWSVS